MCEAAQRKMERMSVNNFFVDIHCHTTLRALNTAHTKVESSIWQKTENGVSQTPAGRLIRLQSKEVAKESQANLYAMSKGQVRVIFDSLYPIEKGFLSFRKVPGLMVSPKGNAEVVEALTGVAAQRFREIQSNDSYFSELMQQYEFIVNGQGESPCQTKAYKVVKNYSELEKVLQEDEETLALVLNIEGAHAFGCGLKHTENIATKDLKKILSYNIQKVKQLDFPPFSVNLAHHFWNQLCGHVRSFKPAVFAALNQSRGLNGGITELGWHVLQELLTHQNGRRIVVDIKHMSVPARMEYYQFVRRYNYINSEDKIPILCSHTGANGFKDMKSSMEQADRAPKLKQGYLHQWSINLSDEEVRIIHESEGLIGIMLDKSVLASSQTLREIKQLKTPEAQKKAYVQLILENMFHMVAAIGERSAWDVLSIGSDYDGIITHIDCYENAARFTNLKTDLINYLHKYQPYSHLWFDYTPEQLIDKVMCTNAMDFLRKYFK